MARRVQLGSRGVKLYFGISEGIVWAQSFCVYRPDKDGVIAAAGELIRPRGDSRP